MSDKDSLFGSPPPSPTARGRSPLLALPESSGWCLDAQTCSQNVGTIALPGSHNHSELPVFIEPALPSGNQVLQLRPPAQRAPAPQRRQRASKPARPTPCHPTPAPHNEQTDRTLRDLVGLISHFEPLVTTASSRPPPIMISSSRASQPPEFHPPGTAENPIEIDAPGPADAVNSALIALAGTVASALKLPTGPRDAPSLSEPTVNNVLHCIKHDPKLIPALQATYEYLGSIPNNSQPPPRSFSHVTTNEPDPSAGKKKKRKRKYSGPQIPAGAGHWDIPFPFAPGQEPKNYPSQWQLERGRRVLGELLGLFERGFAKARGDDVMRSGGERPSKKQRKYGSNFATGNDLEGSVVGADEKGSTPLLGGEGGGLDHQRMSDWLSSVPAPPTSSSIMDSTNAHIMPSPSPSDPTLPSSNELLDFMASLDPNFPGELSIYEEGKESDFDFAGAFDDLDVGIGGEDMNWQAMFEPGIASQSINDITAFPMEVPNLHSFAPASSNDFVIDPALMALSYPQHVPQPSQPPPQDIQTALTSSTTAVNPPDAISFTADATDALSSLVGLSAGRPTSQYFQCHQSTPMGGGRDVDMGDTQSIDAHSLFTVPTGSASSSQRECTPTVHARNPASPAPGIPATSSTLRETKVQRRAAVLAKAHEHRDRLLEKLEQARLQRWELIIEGGVLRNLEKVGMS